MLDLVGKKLGKYEIIGKIGQGGMATVYKAIDTTLQRTVALKVMLPHLATDAGFVKRFQHEAVTAANLKHPHIVTIYEVGEQGASTTSPWSTCLGEHCGRSSRKKAC